MTRWPGKIAVLILVMLLSPAAGSAASGRASSLEVNKRLALSFLALRDAGGAGDLRKIMSEDYIEHAPSLRDYREPQLKALTDAAGDKARRQVVRVLAEGDQVWVYSRQRRDNGQRAGMDMFRVADGKLAEHWAIGETVNEDRKNANDNFAVGRGPQDATGQPVEVVHATAPASMARNKAVVRSFFNAQAERNADQLRQVMRADYIQHNAFLADGRDGLIAGLEAARVAGRPQGPSNELIRAIAEGDYVWIWVRTQDGKRAQLNQFRIENGQLAEHWGLYEDIPAVRENTNDVFGAGRGGAADFTH